MLLQTVIFFLSLFFLVWGADVFLDRAERVGLALGLSPFIVGVTIVAFGTSFPELFTAMSAAFRDVTEIIPANVFGSNIANILLVIGFSAVVGKKLVVTKSLIDVDLPLLAIGTAVLLGLFLPFHGEEAVITRGGSLILLLTYGAYFLYSIFHKEEEKEESPEEKELEKIPDRKERRDHLVLKEEEERKKPRITVSDVFFLILGILALIISANYLVDSVANLSEMTGVGVGVISILAVALGGSLPELVVCAKAAYNNKPEVALGNVFGSNTFNTFIVIGLPGIFQEISVDDPTLYIGLPVMIVATLLFIISGISRRIHNWEGIFFLALYAIFVGKILEFF